MVHLKLEKLRLNDEKIYTVSDHLVPTEAEVCEAIIDIWNEDPSNEELPLDALYDKLIKRCEFWKISKEGLLTALISHNLYAPTLNKGNLCFASISSSTLDDNDIEPKRLLGKVTIKNTAYGKGLFATKFLAKGVLIFHESIPVSVVSQVDKQSLVMRSKCCGLCSTSLIHSLQFVMKNNLDCSACDTVWCSKNCKRLDTSHALLRHSLSRNALCSSTMWAKFEDYCLKHSLQLIYAVAILYSRHLTDPSSDHWRIFKSLCSMDHPIPYNMPGSKKVPDLNISLFNNNEQKVVSNFLEEKWSTAFELLQNTFPKLDMTYNEFLRLVSCFSLNQIMGQVYALSSHINHSCEPNVRYEVEPKYGIKFYSRKDINEGEELFMTYINPLHPVILRRRSLRVNYGFLCQCKRCCQEHTTHMEDRLESPPPVMEKRRKSSMKSSRPSLKELLENGTEFDLEIPSNIVSKRRASVRFDSTVTLAVEEESYK